MVDYRNNKKDKKKSKNNIALLSSYRFKVDEFAMRGLNRYRNFLSSPANDDPCYLQLDTKDDVYNFCNTLLQKHKCYNSAIFLVFKDGTHAMCVTNIEYNEELEEPEIIGMFVLDGSDIDAFAKLDSDLRLCCYGLMIEHDQGWEICE